MSLYMSAGRNPVASLRMPKDIAQNGAPAPPIGYAGVVNEVKGISM